jgi:hypothetical protein
VKSLKSLKYLHSKHGPYEPERELMLVGSTPRRTDTCATLFIEAIGYLCWLLQSTANLNRYIVRLNVGDAVHEHKISGKIMVFSVQVIVSSNVRVNIGTKNPVLHY